MGQFLQATLNGLLHGGLLALVGVGFSVVWGVMNVVNLAHGAFVVLGAYIAWLLPVDPLIGMFVSFAALFALGYVVQRGLINLIVNAPIFLTLLLTFGLELVLVQGMNIAFTADIQGIPTSYASRALTLPLDVRVPVGRLIACVIAIGLTLSLVVFMGRTRTGLAIQATGMDRGAARLMGINARHVYALTYGLAAALAGLAGAMIAMVGSFHASDAGQYTLLSFVVAVLGGLGNMYGALLGGLVLGLAESWAGQYIAGTWSNAVAFAVLLLVLLLRPAGLAGRAFYEARHEV